MREIIYIMTCRH